MATPCRHGPPGSRPIVGDVIGFGLRWQGQEHGVVWITGDTVLYDEVRKVPERLRIGTALLHLGGVRFPITGPLRYTMTAGEAVELCGLARPHTAIPIHYEGWKHFREGRDAAERAFAARAGGGARLASAGCRSARLPHSAHDERKGHRPGALSATKSRSRDLRRARRSRQHGCWDHLIVAPLWVAYRANLGTLLRTCDAAGACMAVPDTPHYHEALAVGDTLMGGRRPCIHWLPRGKERWIRDQRRAGSRIVAVELAEGATPLPRLAPADRRTVVLLGNEQHGIPDAVVAEADDCVEIPMVGRGASLNVAVAGSLVLYRLAGLS